MEKLLLVGPGGFGRVVLEHASSQFDCTFLEDGEASVVDGMAAIVKTYEIEKFFPEYKFLLVTIGSNTIRERHYKESTAIGYTFFEHNPKLCLYLSLCTRWRQLHFSPRE